MRALITGITGQDGSYLAEFLLEKGYEVYGFVRRTSYPTTERIKHIVNDLCLIEGDIADYQSIVKSLHISQPDEVYNLAAQSHVGTSFQQPYLTTQITGIGVLNIIQALKEYGRDVKIYQAGSSEMFGKVQEIPQKETTPFHPRSPYGIAKCFAHHTVVNARESGLYACNGILFNHESPRRGSNFVTKKIVEYVSSIAYGGNEKLYLGNLNAVRDWGYAKDYVEAMWMMLQHEKADDYVIATGECKSVRDFLTTAFNKIGIKDWSDYIVSSQEFYRPTEVETLQGNYNKAYKTLGWYPKTKFHELVEIMLDAELDSICLKN
jgi:GDPmannose 4,6-dehydratase